MLKLIKFCQAKCYISAFRTQHDKVKELCFFFFFICTDKKFPSYVLQVHNDGGKTKNEENDRI